MEGISLLFSALHSAGFIIGGLFVFLIGAAILADQFFWRLKGQRVKARIADVRVNVSSLSLKNDEDGSEVQPVAKQPYQGEIYYPVFEYTSRAGERIRAECDSGSNAMHNKIPGTEEYILVSESEPRRARRLGYGLLIFGLIMVGISFWLFGVVFQASGQVILKLVVALALLCFLMSSVLARIPWREKPLSMQEWKVEKAQSFLKKREAMSILPPAEWRARLHYYNRMNALWVPIPLAMGGGLCFAGYTLQEEWWALDRDIAQIITAEQAVWGLYGAGILILWSVLKSMYSAARRNSL